MMYNIYYTDMQNTYIFDKHKNVKLKAERGVCFDDVIQAIYDGNLLDIIPHYNKTDYSHQMVMILEINHYVYLVPYIEDDGCLILKTVFPSRKYSKLYLGGKS